MREIKAVTKTDGHCKLILFAPFKEKKTHGLKGFLKVLRRYSLTSRTREIYFKSNAFRQPLSLRV
jgi:hypothetical protein